MNASLTSIACGAALLAAAAAEAQRDTRPASTITVVGCLTEQANSPIGTTGRAGRPSAAPELLLTDATVQPSRPAPTAVPGSRPSGQGSGTVPPADSSTARPDARPGTYTLLGSRTSELSKYTGRRVEVVGTLDLDIAPTQPPRPDSSPADGQSRVPEREGNPDGSTDRPGRGDASGRTEPVPPSTAHPSAALRLTVASFKPIAGTCG